MGRGQQRLRSRTMAQRYLLGRLNGFKRDDAASPGGRRMFDVILTGFLIGAVVLLWLPPFSELLCLLARRRVEPLGSVTGQVPRLLVLVPAHNEELMIARCVRSLLDMSYPPHARRIVVVADNCTDATARIAVEHGAESLARVEAWGRSARRRRRPAP